MCVRVDLTAYFFKWIFFSQSIDRLIDSVRSMHLTIVDVLFLKNYLKKKSMLFTNLFKKKSKKSLELAFFGRTEFKKKS